MKTRALIITALVSTGILFSACGKKEESTDMPTPDTTAAPATPSADTAAAPAPAPAPAPAIDSAAMHTDSANMKNDGAKMEDKKDAAKTDTTKKM